MPPIALTDSQLDAIMRASQPLRKKFDAEHQDYKNSRLAWEKAREAATKIEKGTRVHQGCARHMANGTAPRRKGQTVRQRNIPGADVAE
jgi:hypothetical protein